MAAWAPLSPLLFGKQNRALWLDSATAKASVLPLEKSGVDALGTMGVTGWWRASLPVPKPRHGNEMLSWFVPYV